MSRQPSSHAKGLPVTGMASNKVFWIRPANPELDRSGEWLLKNLTTTRARLMPRANPT